MKRIVVILLAILISPILLSCGEDCSPLKVELASKEHQIANLERQIESLEKNKPKNPTKKEKIIADESFTLKAGFYIDFKFTITKEMIEPQINGRFAIRKLAIEVWLFDDNNFTKWKNHKKAYPVYYSGEYASGKFDIVLTKADLYHLIVDNTAAWWSAKTGDIKATLTYKLR